MDMIDEIKKWRKEKNAVILAHYYVNPEVQQIAEQGGVYGRKCEDT